MSRKQKKLLQQLMDYIHSVQSVEIYTGSDNEEFCKTLSFINECLDEIKKAK